MKLVTFLILATFATTAYAQTTILYDDGSTYTVKPNEKVYVHQDSMYRMFGDRKTNSVIFKKQGENKKRDYVIQPPASQVPQYCDEIGLTFGGGCIQKPKEEPESCDGLSFGGGCVES